MGLALLKALCCLEMLFVYIILIRYILILINLLKTLFLFVINDQFYLT